MTLAIKRICVKTTSTATEKSFGNAAKSMNTMIVHTFLLERVENEVNQYIS